MFDEWKIPLYKIYNDDEDIQLITKIIKRGSRWAMGPEIEEFENALKDYLDTEYCASLNSGTSSLNATLLAYGLKENDEVLIPSFTFIATANSILLANVKPKFTDIEENTFGLDPHAVSKNISTNTKAIMPVDIGGQPCNILEIKKLAEENNLILIEDAAEALGSTVNGKKVGSISDSTIFSFCGNKVLTTGEGGAVVTNSKQIYEKIKLIRSHGRTNDSAYFENPLKSQYVGLGYNWRMSSFTAALGLSQLRKLDKLIHMRQENAKYISSKLSKFEEIKLPNEIPNSENIYQMYTIRVSAKIRDNLQNFLLTKKIFCKVYFEPIHHQSFYRSYLKNEISLPVTEKISQEVLTLPLYPNMENEEKNYLVDSVSEFFENN
ncbi:MAG: DegT/DnrJ/EryC1/StrS family aminotransferase [Nitrosopumilaceae archaeon]